MWVRPTHLAVYMEVVPADNTKMVCSAGTTFMVQQTVYMEVVPADHTKIVGSAGTTFMVQSVYMEVVPADC